MVHKEKAATRILFAGAKQLMSYFSSISCVRETRRSLERLTCVSSQEFPVTVVQVARWYLLRHLHAKGDEELIKVST